jgi:hypothetical protein
MVSGYADPKKLPANERTWWPLKNDPVIRAIPKAKIIKLHQKFMSLKFK